MFAKGVERPAGTEADNFTHGSPTESSQKLHGSISESMSDAINFAAFDAG